MDLGTVIEIGWRAADVLETAPVARILAPMRASICVIAAGELLWLGGPSEVMHRRAVLFSEPPAPSACAPGDALAMPRWAVRPWRPGVPRLDAEGVAALRRGAERLAKASAALGEPVGFGAWLMDRPLTFPLNGAGKAADALARACATDDATAAAQAAAELLGLGNGLTPSGDDFVGGAFFARAAVGQTRGTDTERWRQAAATVRATASASTGPISAALLGDLLEGHGWSPLHDLVRTLASDDDTATMNAAERLIGLGHSSGWDVLAGFVAGAAR